MPVRRPDPPRGLRTTLERGVVKLSWQRPARDRERLGYYVYRSRLSGAGYERVSAAAVRENRFTDKPKGRGPWFYRVSMVEHSGLEGLPSDEVRAGRGDWKEPMRLYLDAERGKRDGMNDAFTGKALSLHCVELKRREAEGSVEIGFAMPKAGRVRLWARMSGTEGKLLGFSVSCDGEEVGTCEAITDEWLWVRVLDAVGRPAEIDLDAGKHALRFATTSHHVRLDRVLITDDMAWLPESSDGLPGEALAQVKRVYVEPVGVFALEVTWEPVDDPRLHHYNIYASRDPLFACEQRNLIASPTGPRWLDWGLEASTPYWSSTEYFYRTTAVDQFGNESPPSEVASGRTGVPRGIRAAHKQTRRRGDAGTRGRR